MNFKKIKLFFLICIVSMKMFNCSTSNSNKHKNDLVIGGLIFLSTSEKENVTNPIEEDDEIKNSKVIAGTYSSYYKNQEGIVFAWGGNQYGQLGDGTLTNRLNPIKILENITQIASGYNHTLSIRNDGNAFSWGGNDSGQLGTGNFTDSATPISVLNLKNVMEVAADGFYGSFSLALISDGTVYSWGKNDLGQLGDNTMVDKITPVKISISDIIQVETGESHSLALDKKGSVWSWGSNDVGQLGNGSTINSLIPIQITGLSNIIDIDAGSSHSIALSASGQIYVWGFNYYGQLGVVNSSGNTYLASPVLVSNISDDNTNVEAGKNHTMILKKNGTVWSTGYNKYGQLGNNSTVDQFNFIQVHNLVDVIDIDGGGVHCIAQKSDGTIWTWGSNANGQLGNGTSTDSHLPVQVIGL